MYRLILGLVIAMTVIAITMYATTAQVIDLPPRTGPEGGIMLELSDQELFCDDGSGETFIYSPSENWYGNLFDLPCDVAHLKSVRFYHHGFGFPGPYDYNLHILDASCNEIEVFTGLQAKDASGTLEEEIVDLASHNLCIEGDFMVMIEPLSCADAPANQDCYPSMYFDTSPGGNPAAACSRIRLPSGICVQFTVGGNYGNYLLRTTVECDAAICLGILDTLSVGSATAEPGSLGVEVSVSLVNSIAVGGFEFELTYDTALMEAVGVNRTSRTQDFEIFGVNLEPGSVNLVAIADFIGGGTTPPMPIGSGPVADVVFDIRCQNVPSDTTFALTFVSGSITDSTGLVYTPTVNVDGALTVQEGECPVTGITGQDMSGTDQTPIAFPNPATSVPTIRYYLVQASEVRIEFFDVQGKCVRQVDFFESYPGFYNYRWDGKDESGNPVASGIYFFRVSSAAGLKQGKVIILR